MVTRVNGGPQQGFWFSKDVRVLTITTDLSDWLADLLPAPAGVNSGLEQVLEAVSQYGTVIGVTAIDDDTLHVMVDYANQFVAGNSETDTGTVEAALAADINAIATPNFANTTVDTFDGFAGAVNGTPA
jgi:hypothetical protein